MLKVIIFILFVGACFSASIIVTEYDAWGCYQKDVVNELEIPIAECYTLANGNSTQHTSLYVTRAQRTFPTDAFSIFICSSSTSDCAMPMRCERFTAPKVCNLPSQAEDSLVLQNTHPINTFAPSWSWRYGPGTDYTSDSTKEVTPYLGIYLFIGIVLCFISSVVCLGM